MQIYNTLTRKKEKFVPIEENKVGIYVCGPTVYNYIHVGNARPLVIFDTLRRYFEYKDYHVTFVSNFTDIDDKIIEKAEEEGVDYKEITNKYIKAYKENAKGLGFDEEGTIHPKATEYVEDMIRFIEGLIDKGAAYEVNGDVYFNIDEAKDYGKLSRRNIDELIAGARIDIREDKKNPMDFTLWKKVKSDSEPGWDSPWGKGRPGWHIECSVMSQGILGDTIDIHAGGEDLQFPHHENEIAQSETLTGKTMANYWMHNGMITVDNEKMSKSKGNFFLINDIEKKFDLEIVRTWLLSTHYRNPINFSKEVLEQIENGLERLYTGKFRLERFLESQSGSLTEVEEELLNTLDEISEYFEESMDDDLNTPDGLTALFDIIRFANTTVNSDSSLAFVEKIYNTFMSFANVLGILQKEQEEEILDEEIEELIEKREEARKNKDFETADAIRDELLEQGIILKDTREGVLWERKT